MKMVRCLAFRRRKRLHESTHQWEGQDFLEESGIVLHEDAYYRAPLIYFGGDVPDWRREADRSQWVPRPASPRDSNFGHLDKEVA